jgi:hypothetical protein
MSVFERVTVKMRGEDRRRIAKEHVHRKLIFRLRKFLIIFVVMISVIIYDIISHTIGYTLAFSGIVLGFAIGYLAGHISDIVWHEETSKVVARMDRMGFIFLALYVTFSLSRRWIFGHWIHGAALTAFSFSMAAGIMAGRLFSTRSQIRNILKDQGVIQKLKK